MTDLVKDAAHVVEYDHGDDNNYGNDDDDNDDDSNDGMKD